ncbi:MAG: VanZ family protein [Symbiobacteriia bacterium]
MVAVMPSMMKAKNDKHEGVAHVNSVSRTKLRVVGWVVFVVYLGLLTNVILFKNHGVFLAEVILFKDRGLIFKFASPLPLGVRVREFSNFIPFKTIAYYALGGQSMAVALRNLAGNVVAFFPMGFVLPVLLPKMRSVRNVILIAFGVSLCFEVIQLLTGIGQFDVDDVQLNVLGAAAGWLTYWGIRRVLHGQANQAGGQA